MSAAPLELARLRRAPRIAGSLAGPMRLAEMVYGVWAVMPEPLLEIQAIYETHLRGEKIDVRGVEDRLGHPLANDHRGYEVINGVAVFGVQGIIAPKANLFSQVSGGTSAALVERDLNRAILDSTVRSGALSMDTPGGNVLGIPSVREAVRRFAAVKPIVAHSDGMMASAGYWIAAAANQRYIADSMVQVGSMGVVHTHTDTSGAESKAGIRKTIVVAGKFKRVEGPDGRLTEEGFATIQQRADYVYSVLVANVAEDLGVDVETVLEEMADGRVFIGQQAIDARLVDSFGSHGFVSLETLIEQMATDPSQFAKRRVARIKGTTMPQQISAPARQAAPAAQQSKQAIAAAASAHAKEHGVDFISALKALRLEAAATVAPQAEPDATEPARPDPYTVRRQAIADQAASHAKDRNISINAAIGELGLTAEVDQGRPSADTSDHAERQAKADQARDYADEHGVSIVAAFKALKLVYP